MKELNEQADWTKLTAEEKKRQLFLNQKKTLDSFLTLFWLVVPFHKSNTIRATAICERKWELS